MFNWFGSYLPRGGVDICIHIPLYIHTNTKRLRRRKPSYRPSTLRCIHLDYIKVKSWPLTVGHGRPAIIGDRGAPTQQWDAFLASSAARHTDVYKAYLYQHQVATTRSSDTYIQYHWTSHIVMGVLLAIDIHLACNQSGTGDTIIYTYVWDHILIQPTDPLRAWDHNCRPMITHGSTLHPRLATTYTDNGYIQPYQMCMCMYMQALYIYIYIYIYMSGRLPPGRLTNMYMYNNERS